MFLCLFYSQYSVFMYVLTIYFKLYIVHERMPLKVKCAMEASFRVNAV